MGVGPAVVTVRSPFEWRFRRAYGVLAGLEDKDLGIFQCLVIALDQYQFIEHVVQLILLPLAPELSIHHEANTPTFWMAETYRFFFVGMGDIQHKIRNAPRRHFSLAGERRLDLQIIA
ncbi:hypothetical protein D3C76_1602480 [compost metagenome]